MCHKKINLVKLTATIRENRSSYSQTDDGRSEVRNNLIDCLCVINRICVLLIMID